MAENKITSVMSSRKIANLINEKLNRKILSASIINVHINKKVIKRRKIKKNISLMEQ